MRPPLPLVLPWLCACYRQDSLSESWTLDRLRILAVQAEPAEPQPGETVAFEALIYSPDGEEVPSLWFACLPESAGDYGCELDPAVAQALAGVDPSTLSEEEIAALYEALVDSGFIGALPWLPPTWTAPSDALDGLDDDAAREGVNAVITVQAVPPGADGADDVEAAYKRVPISLAETPNHNPGIAGLRVDGREVADGETVEVARGATVTFEAILEEGAVEDYIYRTSSGEDEQRTEEPYLTWHVEGGSFEQASSLYPDLDETWVAPDAPFEGVLHVVIRDRRGGMGWASLSISVL